MGHTLDQPKDPVHDAAPVLVDDDNVKNEGNPDHVAVQVKEKVVSVKGKLAQAVDQMRKALRDKRSRA
jgi:uncharacterized protein YjbJ (UPF0337 family)